MLKRLLASLMIILLFAQSTYAATIVGATICKQIEWQLEKLDSTTYSFSLKSVNCKRINNFEYLINGTLYDVQNIKKTESSLVIFGKKDSEQTSLQQILDSQEQHKKQEKLCASIKYSYYVASKQIQIAKSIELTLRKSFNIFNSGVHTRSLAQLIRPPRQQH
jgi:hypothetical protein